MRLVHVRQQLLLRNLPLRLNAADFRFRPFQLRILLGERAQDG
jgi:hypothetical protein